MSYFPDGRPSPGVISTRGDADAERDKAGQGALVAPSSVFESAGLTDVQQCYDRLEEIRDELGQLYAKLYAVKADGKNGWGETGAPPMKVRNQITREMDLLTNEEEMLQARVQELFYAQPAEDQDGDAEEDEDELGDMTQPEIGDVRTIGWPDHVAALDSSTSATPSTTNKTLPENREDLTNAKTRL